MRDLFAIAKFLFLAHKQTQLETSTTTVSRRRKVITKTRNSSVDEIGERYRLNYGIVAKLYHPYTILPRSVRLSNRRFATTLAQRDFFDYFSS